jgi:hypothetical protein
MSDMDYKTPPGCVPKDAYFPNVMSIVTESGKMEYIKGPGVGNPPMNTSHWGPKGITHLADYANPVNTSHIYEYCSIWRPAGLTSSADYLGPAGVTGYTGPVGVTGSLGQTGMMGSIGPVGVTGTEAWFSEIVFEEVSIDKAPAGDSGVLEYIPSQEELETIRRDILIRQLDDERLI